QASARPLLTDPVDPATGGTPHRPRRRSYGAEVDTKTEIRTFLVSRRATAPFLYLMRVSILNIGRYIAITIVPTIDADTDHQDRLDDRCEGLDARDDLVFLRV